MAKSKFPTTAALKAALASWQKGGVTIGQVRRSSGIRGTVLIGAILISGTTAQANAILNNGKRAQAPTANGKTAKPKTAKKAAKAATPAPAAATTTDAPPSVASE